MRYTDDVGRGEWIGPRLRDGSTILGVVPSGFDAYARIFHPVEVQRIQWRDGYPHSSSQETLTWAEAAQRLATVAHPLMQWDSLVQGQPDPAAGEAGWQWEEPNVGALPQEQLAAASAVLSRHTSTPHRCIAALWEGWGWVHGGVEPRLELPQRRYLLFETDLDELVRAGGAHLGTDWPNLLWPEDRAWCLASEIDFDSTLIGGSRALVDALLAEGDVEVMELAPTASLRWDADTVNGSPG